MLDASTIDWIMLGLLLLSVLIGLWRGLVYEVLSLLSWVAAFVLAQMFADTVSTQLPIAAGEKLRYPLAFVLVFVSAVFAGGLVAWFAQKLMKSSGLSPFDRVLGGVFGLLRGVMVLLAAAALVSMTSIRDVEAWRQSVGAGVMTTALKGLKPVLPEKFGRYLPA